MNWTREQAVRLDEEVRLLWEHGLPFTWDDPPACTHLTGTLCTRSGTHYLIRLCLPGDYPASPPRAYVLSPYLVTRDGGPLPHPSASMHTLAPDQEGHIQICHSHPYRWNERADNLVKVAAKLRLWLEAYEAHWATGEPIDHYLPHAR